MQDHHIDIATLCKKLNTNLDYGLSSAEYLKRRKKYGENTVKQVNKKSWLSLILNHLTSPLMLVLLLALSASIFIREWHDTIVIALTIIINVTVGFFQEYKAEKTARTLKSYEVSTCLVHRNGEVISIPSHKLVPGDIVILNTGSIVPADLRLFYTVDFSIDESILTGESEAVAKQTNPIVLEAELAQRTNMAYAGTYVVSGKAKGIVVAIGDNSELGIISQLVQETTKAATPLQRQLDKLSWFLGLAMITIASSVFVLGVVRHIPYREMFITAIALSVAALPEGLLIALTVVLAIGMQRILKRHALVRNLFAAETLGSVSVICTDKTGTLTTQHMVAAHIVTPKKSIIIPEKATTSVDSDIELLFNAAVLNNDANLPSITSNKRGSPTEIAFLEAAQQYKLDCKKIRQSMPRIDEIPFSSARMFMATLHQTAHGEKIIVKGALEVILEQCAISSEQRNYFLQEEQKLVEKGLRVIAFAQQDAPHLSLHQQNSNLSLLGLIGLHDPLRPQAAKSLQKLAKAGIRVVLLTGDHQQTAQHIAQLAGIPVNEKTIFSGTQLDTTSDNQLMLLVANINVFARVTPLHKIRIVNAFKKSGATVAMIGDGVNDAPALKAATIGVALGSGTDVARETSDMILIDNNLATIVAAVHEGRILFQNIQKIIVYLLANGVVETSLIAGSLILGLPLPLVATQILWANIINHSFPYMALTLEQGDINIMQEKPRPTNELILNKIQQKFTFVIGGISTMGLFAFYYYLLNHSANMLYIRTMMFTTLTITSLLYVFSVRSIKRSLFFQNPFENTWLIGATLLGFIMQIAVVYCPPLQSLFSTTSLKFYDWGIIGIVVTIILISIEAGKIFLGRIFVIQKT